MLLCPLSSEIFLSKANRASGNFALPALFKAIGFAGGGSRERLRSGSCDREGLRALRAFVFIQKLTDQIVRENHKFGRSTKFFNNWSGPEVPEADGNQTEISFHDCFLRPLSTWGECSTRTTPTL
jgi:hypothetical protein